MSGLKRSGREFLQDHHQTQWSTKSHWIKGVLIVNMVWHSQGYKLKSAKGKCTWGKVQEKPDTGFQVSSLSGVALLATVYDNMCKCCQPGKLTPALVSGAFTGVQSCRRIAPTWLTWAIQSLAPQSKDRSLSWITVSINYLILLVLKDPGPQVYKKRVFGRIFQGL